MASLAAGNQAGVAKSANIYSFKVVQDSGSGSYTALTQGVGEGAGRAAPSMHATLTAGARGGHVAPHAPAPADSMLTMGAQTPPLTPAVVNMSLVRVGEAWTQGRRCMLRVHDMMCGQSHVPGDLLHSSRGHCLGL